MSTHISGGRNIDDNLEGGVMGKDDGGEMNMTVKVEVGQVVVIEERGNASGSGIRGSIGTLKGDEGRKEDIERRKWTESEEDLVERIEMFKRVSNE